MSVLSPETRAFLDAAARGDEPSAEDRMRMRRKLTADLGTAALATTTLAIAAQATATTAGSLSTAASLAAGKASASASVGLLGKIALAAALAGAVSTTTMVIVRSTQVEGGKPSSVEHRGRVAQAAEQPSPAPREAVVAPLPPSTEPLEPSDKTLVPESVAPRIAGQSEHVRKPLTASAPEQPVANMAEELVLLRQAQIALREGRAADALSISTDHGTRFPQGALREERSAVEMLARCAQGSASDAQLASFLEASPESPLKARVREACKAEP